uniref:DNA-directed RNA polymerase RpoA/D/Rpb3-type domain-containing protein n=1 Tax=Oryza punctata TaxID=4537 RepID=A0A0E0LUS7_ORYPU
MPYEESSYHRFLQWKIEKVLMVDNTSVTPNEVLSHRLGLIPLDANGSFLLYLRWLPENSQLNISSSAQSGNKQKTYTSFNQTKKDISKRILVIELEAYAVKGMGKVHSKWYPVATTAWYRMLPEKQKLDTGFGLPVYQTHHLQA